MCCSVFMFYNMFLNIAPFRVFPPFAAICHYTTEMNFERYFSFRNSEAANGISLLLAAPTDSALRTVVACRCGLSPFWFVNAAFCILWML